MPIIHNPADIPAPSGNYAYGLEVRSGARLLFISGQIPGDEEAADFPRDFETQCRIIWRNIFSILASAQMEPRHLVKVTTYLTHPDQVVLNSRIRQEILGDHKPALTVMIAQTLTPDWLLEIEAIAAVEE
jgi:2-iminobutanoate/2-iminopropanoate deaminase